jgi:hypothetical protein
VAAKAEIARLSLMLTAVAFEAGRFAALATEACYLAGFVALVEARFALRRALTGVSIISITQRALSPQLVVDISEVRH